jgi:pyruvate-formate lyase-activating enzyme
VALMVTRRCNMACGHCSVESGPQVRGEPSETDLIAWVREAAAAGVRTLRITGGEPMLRAPIVVRLVRECRRLGIVATINSNAFWGRNRFQARRHLRALRRAGLGGLIVSYDRYHAEFQGAAPVLNLVHLAEEAAVPVRITLVRGTDEHELSDIVGQLEGSRGTRLSVYDLQPVGRARGLGAELHRAEVEGFCTACAFPAITDDGRLIACNGPAYFEPPGSPLVLGSLRDTPLAELLDRHRCDPVLDTIRTRGPAGLRDELKRTPGFEDFPFRARYAGICDLCHHVTRDRDAVAALRARLDRPEAAATRLALWQVIDGNRRQGALNLGYVNGIGASRLFLGAAWDPAAGFPHNADQILGRADFDWRAVGDYLCGCGLARPLASVLNHQDLRRWAPQFFLDTIRARSTSDTFLELLQREAIGRIDDVLVELGSRAVLLKGAALMMRAPAGLIARAPGDVDFLVDADVASRLRARLLTAGFTGPSGDGPTTFQHLAPVFYRGIPIEIHTKLMAGFFDLPESEMLASARPVPVARALDVMGPEALVLHTCTHASASFFSFGLKTAWDLLSILRVDPDLDWSLLETWAARSRGARSFWIPIRVLADELGLPVPAAFLRHAPMDRGAQRLMIVARTRLFRATESIFDLDVLTKAGVMLLLQSSTRGRLEYLGTTFGWRASRPDTWGAALNRAQRAGLLRQAWRQFMRYRRAVRQAPPVAQEADSRGS